MDTQPLPAPSLWEIVTGVWPWFWGFAKILWPVWIVLLVLILIKLGMYKADKYLENRSFKKENKQCTQCLEWIPKEAKKCKHCGSKI